MKLSDERLEELTRRAVFEADGRVFYKAAIHGVSVAEEHWLAAELLALRKRLPAERKRKENPCSDCFDGYCTMNCGPAVTLKEDTDAKVNRRSTRDVSTRHAPHRARVSATAKDVQLRRHRRDEKQRIIRE
jgi:hypothetical protein